ncbi:hypothetical protein MTO96_026524 [Rhipicephalus appendiculatus]
MAIYLLPAKSWGVHRLEHGDEKSVVFLELKHTQGLSSDPSSGGVSSFTPFSAPKIVQIDEKMEVRVFFMGKCVTMEQLNCSGDLWTLEDVQSFLQHVDQIRICAGGPNALEHPHVERESASSILHNVPRPFCQFADSPEEDAQEKTAVTNGQISPPVVEMRVEM